MVRRRLRQSGVVEYLIFYTSQFWVFLLQVLHAQSLFNHSISP